MAKGNLMEQAYTILSAINEMAEDDAIDKAERIGLLVAIELVARQKKVAIVESYKDAVEQAK